MDSDKGLAHGGVLCNGALVMCQGSASLCGLVPVWLAPVHTMNLVLVQIDFLDSTVVMTEAPNA